MKRKNYIGKILIVLLILSLLVAGESFGLTKFSKGLVLKLTQPFVRTASQATYKIKGAFAGLLSIRSRLAERDGLEKKVRSLEAEAALLAQEKEENSHLRNILDLRQRLPFSTIAASVVSKDPTGITGSVIIDQGAGDGVSPGSAIIDEYGSLLGVVKQVYQSSSEFLLVNDGSVKIDAHVPGKSVLGLVIGSHGLGLSFDLVSQEVELNSGERVVTSGLTGKLPEGILIGTIDKQASNSSELFQRLSVAPAANTKDFQFVLVITGF